MFNDLIKDLPGNLVGKENDFDAIVEARNCKDLSSLEVLQKKCDAFINKLCNEPRRKGEKRTRIEIWSDPEGTRKAPPIRKLMNLVPERIARDTAIDYWHFQLGNKEYEPRLKNEEDLYRWMIAAVRDEFVPLRAAKLDEGWECDICLDREDSYWCEGVLKTEQYLPRDKYPSMLNNVLSRAIQEHNDLVDNLRRLMSEIGLDRVYKHEISKKPVMISDSVAENTPCIEGSANPSENPPPKQDSLEDASNNQSPKTSSVSVRTARSRKAPESGGRRFDWSRVPKAANTLSRIEREMRDDKEDT